MRTLEEEIDEYDREQRKLLQTAAADNPDTYFEEAQRIHEESRVQYLEILSRHNRKRETAYAS